VDEFSEGSRFCDYEGRFREYEELGVLGCFCCHFSEYVSSLYLDFDPL